ncbi:hypothetical protein MKEN_01470400 [Mycena kentingensis (nom. inval.)]|nr:hypothetical protein MKEN_01470400 [Mycena kentingensis (nom. inval.)]
MSAHVFAQTVAPASSTTEPLLPPERGTSSLSPTASTSGLNPSSIVPFSPPNLRSSDESQHHPSCKTSSAGSSSSTVRRTGAISSVNAQGSSPSPQPRTTRNDFLEELRAVFARVRPERLAIDITPFYPADTYQTMEALATSPTFASLTHFDVIERIDGDPRLLGFLVALPALTHLSYNHDLDEDPTRALLNDCKNLVVLVRLAELYRNLCLLEWRLPVTDDPRLVVCAFDHWWDAAEDFVKKKRAGEIPWYQFYLRDPGEEEESHAEGRSE